MRTFCISLALLCIVFGFALSFFFFSRGQMDTFSAAFGALPAVTDEASLPAIYDALILLKEQWSAQKTWLSLGTSYTLLSTVDLALTETEAYCLAGDVSGYTAGRAALLLALSRIKQNELSFF